MQFRNRKSKAIKQNEKTFNFIMTQVQPTKNHFSSISSGDSQNRLSSTRERIQSLIYQGKICSLQDSFLWEFQKLNRKAVKLIDQGLIEQAELSLNNAEQILQQAGIQGKNINFTHIMALFHNQICLNQHSWQLQTCVSYVQAVIFNLKCQIQKDQKQKSASISVQNLFELKAVLAQYYLLFCAFNSQLKQHDTALIAAKRSNNLLQEYFKDINQKLTTISKFIYLKQNLQEIKWISTLISNLQKSTLLQLTNDLLSLKRNKVLHNKCSFYEFSQQFQSYTIAHLMQLSPILSFTIKKDANLDKSNFLQKIIMFSISYFTMATQLRLLAKKVLIESLQLKQISQYKQSQCYHLKAIILILYFVPFDLLYLQHLLQSFKLHYSIELVNSLSSYQNCKSYQMFTEKMKHLFVQLQVKQNEYCKSKLINHASTINSKLSQHKKDKIINRTNIFRKNGYQNSQKSKSLLTHNTIQVFSKHLKNNRLKSKKTLLKNACMTSVQSPDKLSFTNTPRRLSPRVTNRYQKQSNQNEYAEVQKLKKNKRIQIVSEYFDSQINFIDGIKLQKSKTNNKNNQLRHIDLNKMKMAYNQDNRSKSKKSIKRQQPQKKRKDENLKTVKSTSYFIKNFK